jgi:hypothetical protein
MKSLAKASRVTIANQIFQFMNGGMSVTEACYIL